MPLLRNPCPPIPHPIQNTELKALVFIAKLSQAPAPAGLSLALFPNYPATRPGRPNPTGIVFFSATFQPELNAI